MIDILRTIADSIADLGAKINEQAQLLNQTAGVFGVYVPGLLTIKEVEEGDDMTAGVARPSAADLGLVAWLAQAPGSRWRSATRRGGQGQR